MRCAQEVVGADEQTRIGGKMVLCATREKEVRDGSEEKWSQETG